MAKFVGNKETKMVHRAGCGALKGIKRSNRVSFGTLAAARKKRFKVCKLCKK